MNHHHIKAILDGVLPEVKTAIASVQKPLQEQLVRIETRLLALEEVEVTSVPGPKGDKGDAGLDGKDGADGMAGLPGADGAPGKDGKDGRDGIDGKDGAPGESGPPGDISFAPEELSLHVASAIRLLAESPEPSVAAAVSPPINLSLDLRGTYSKKSYRFERGVNNEVLAAHEEAQI